MTSKPDFSDLSVRIGSAIVLTAVAGLAIWYGLETFRLLLLGIAAVMVWETTSMHRAGQKRSLIAASVAAVSLAVAFFYTPLVACLLAIVGLLFLRLPQLQISVSVSVAVLIACWMLAHVYQHDGVIWCVWILVCVIASDVGGYFGGKLIGGPKFWPAVSPKKTWAGIVSGWFLSGLVSVSFEMYGFAVGAGFLGGALVAATSQAGDMLESAMKRRAGVKDSSSIIPGHGGFFDRFDGVLLAAICVGSYSLLTGGLP